MIQVVEYEEFLALKQEVGEVRKENQFLRSIILAQRDLSRKQTMQALGCSEKTLKRLTVAQKLGVRYEGIKPYYSIESVINYLKGQKIDEDDANNRVMSACYLGS